MQTNLLWTGREYHSLENCLVHTNEIGNYITATIVGYYEEKIYQVNYHIQTNNAWETLSVDISCRHSDQQWHIHLKGDGKGNWQSDDMTTKQFKIPLEQLQGCIDVDIPLTPFTNTLPIRRLQLMPGQEHIIKVIYLDLLAQQITPVQQRYKRIADKAYHYENIPNDFEADIEVDDQGLVVDYPLLFVRKSALPSNYR
jgi:uncharacterized protein